MFTVTRTPYYCHYCLATFDNMRQMEAHQHQVRHGYTPKPRWTHSVTSEQMLELFPDLSLPALSFCAVSPKKR